MELQTRINSDLKVAILSKDESKKSFLRVIIGELNREKGKDLSDDVVIATLRKMKKDSELMNNDYEVSILNEYLPITLDYDQTKIAVSDIISANNYSGVKDMGKVVAEIAKNSQLDRKIASQIAKELLM